MAGETPKRKRRPRGEGSLYKRKSDDMWVGTVPLPPDDEGRVRRATVARRDRNEALKEFQKLRRAVEDGHTPTEGRRPSVSKVFALWLDSKTRLGPSTRDTYESQFRRRVEPFMGERQINAPTSTDLRRLMAAWQEEGLASQTILNAYNVLSPFFDWARKEGFRRDNPMERIEIPGSSNVSSEPLDASEASMVLQSAYDDEDPYYLRWAL